MQKRILVTGAGGPASINFIRSINLVHEKIEIVGTEAGEYSYYLAPVEKVYKVPWANSPDYIAALNEIIEKEDIEFLHAQADLEVRVISDNREKLSAAVFLPSKRAINTCQDKLEATNLWMKKNVPVARAVRLRDEHDVEKAFDELGSPIWIRATHGAGGRGSTRSVGCRRMRCLMPSES